MVVGSKRGLEFLHVMDLRKLRMSVNVRLLPAASSVHRRLSPAPETISETTYLFRDSYAGSRIGYQVKNRLDDISPSVIGEMQREAPTVDLQEEQPLLTRCKSFEGGFEHWMILLGLVMGAVLEILSTGRQWVG
jgi:hypothetical protein